MYHPVMRFPLALRCVLRLAQIDAADVLAIHREQVLEARLCTIFALFMDSVVSTSIINNTT